MIFFHHCVETPWSIIWMSYRIKLSLPSAMREMQLLRLVAVGFSRLSRRLIFEKRYRLCRSLQYWRANFTRITV